MPVPEATPATEEAILPLIERLEARQIDLTGQIGALDLNQCESRHDGDNDDPEDLFLAQLSTAFSHLPSLNASFRPTRSTSASNLPRYSTLSRLYELAKLRPAALEVLRDQVEAIIQRPGPTLAEGDGGWVIALIEVSVVAPFHCDSTEQLGHAVPDLPRRLHHLGGDAQVIAITLPRPVSLAVPTTRFTPDD